MKLFTDFHSTNRPQKPSQMRRNKPVPGKVTKRQEVIKREKPHISKAEIREKLAKRNEENNASKKAMAERGRVAVLDKNNESDNNALGNFTNNPNSEVTQGKLLGILNKGGFDFSSKEKTVLAQILNK